MIHRHELPLLLTGLLSTLCGVGLSRMAFTALMPALVQAHWFSADQAAYLGAATLLGYLVGALGAHWLTERWSVPRVLLGSFIAVTLSFALSALPQPFVTFFAWRCLAGIAAAVLMVVGPSAAMAALPPARRAVLGPVLFAGVGVGALLSATLIPALVRLDLPWTWAALALVSALCGFWGWRASRQIPAAAAQLVRLQPAAPAAPLTPPTTGRLWLLPVLWLMAAYACDAAGFVPHTVFWVDYLARERELGTAFGALQWGLFGLGALLGPIATAACAARWDWHRAVVGGMALKTAAVCIPVALPWLLLSGPAPLLQLVAYGVSSFIVGALSPGIAALTSGRLLQLVGPLAHKRVWGYATAVFATAQALSGTGMAWLYAQSHIYQPLFALAAGLLALGTLLAWASGRR
ncbi:YbfB/YjiJ family MFS transporter [Acidovorax sp. CCYZU-2555]|uniref:YbfB/YjiJ family MFS transporter n=1 Tax=Acidovorax sp. CCYZU-2555 TaxID=2835042 RepID=UPI001BD198B0|nr:YbfB/YjiJ family MFS transporter [Acidovorax sp. CCYZU-2555]MBS7781335.1 YbfB/YjiJ family MFS transporter [Acidovorax sp. CCYZU-2555]